MDETLREITLPGGQTVLARVTPAPGAVKPGGYGSDDLDIGVGSRAAAKLEQLGELIQGVGQSVMDAARSVQPDEATITFGVEIVAKPGKAVAVLADGEAKASLEVSLVWKLDERRSRAAAAPTAGTTAVPPTGATAAPPAGTPAAPTTNATPQPPADV
ncbi:CU044_2847 family protein [Streptomyces sp. NPDC004393]|uniref:CU044_2847 family protein n=1 Tax=Streptomyces sp. NPDC004533 TaxID=3154278 RepID=UPI0033AB5752